MREKKWLNIKFFTVAFISLISVVAMVFAQYGYAIRKDPVIKPKNAIDITHGASLTVHKFTAPSALTDSKGLTADPAPAGKPVAGVKFAISVVDYAQVDLTTNKGWENAAKIIQQYKMTKNLKSITVNGSPLKLYHINDEVQCGTPLITRNEMCNNELVTNSQGEVTFGGFTPQEFGKIARLRDFTHQPYSGVKPGRLYFVQEIDASNATVDGKKVDVSPSEPFFVSVPLTNQKDPSKWVYNVNVYPKNAVVGITKSVSDDKSYTVGNQITYNLTADIPGRVSADGLNKYVVMDQLSNSVQYVSGESTEVAICVVSDGSCNRDASYQKLSSADYTISNTNNLLKFTFTTSGLKKLSLAQNDNASVDASLKKKVQFTFDVKITSAPSKEDNLAVINNQAYLVPDNHHSDVPPTPSKPGMPGQPTTPGQPPAPGLPPEGVLPPIPSNNVKVKFAKVKFHKVDQTGAPLAGAKFQIWLDSKSDTDYSCATLGQQVLPLNTQHAVDPNAFVTSDAQGNVIFNDPLHVSDYINDQIVSNTSQKIHYCLVEVDAPQGYEKLPQAIPFTLDSNNVSDLVYTYGKDIVNVKHNAGFNLPLTGSSAMVILTVTAGASIAGAFFFLFKRRKSAK